MDVRPREVRLCVDSAGRCPVDEWLCGLRDAKARAAIRERITRLMLGNPGDVKPVGGGVSEMRVAFGPGYRINYAEESRTVAVLLCAGTKATQTSRESVSEGL